MRVFWLLTRLRMAEVMRVTSSAVFFFGFPLALLLATCLLFSGGHPYEQLQVGVVGSAPPEGASEVRWQALDSAASARIRLATGQLNAALVKEAAGWLVLATPRQALVAEGLLTLLPRPARVEQVRPLPWGYAHYLCPGILAFSVILSGLFGLGYSMARYRQSHFLRKLATTPLSKWSFLGSQVVGRGLLVLLQCALLMAVMVLALGLPLSLPQALWVLLLCTLGLAVFLGLGLLLACAVSNESVLSDTINALGWPIVLGSGIFFPTDLLPGPLPLMAHVLPSTRLVDLLRDVMLYGQTPAPGSLIVLLVWSGATFLLGGLVFDWLKD